MSEQVMKRQRINDLINVETTPKFFCLSDTKLFNEKGKWKIEQKRKESFLTALATAI